MNTNTNTNTVKAIAILDKAPVFKSAELNKATATIFEAVNKYNATATETRKAVAVELYHIEKGKLYKDDGHKSLADYAATIGLDKSLAHKLENAGRLLDSENETIRNYAATADYSKLAILASADEKEVQQAIESGEITADTTQAQVKEWKASKKPVKATVLPNYELDFTVYSKKGMESVHYDSTILEDVEEFKDCSWGKVKTADGTVVVVGLRADGAMVRIIKQEKVKSVKKDRPRPGTQFDPSCLTDEMLAAAMAELARRQQMDTEEEDGE